jgi:hypothetical protein
MYCFNYSLYFFVSGRYYLDTVNFGNHQDLQGEDFEQQLAGNQGK